MNSYDVELKKKILSFPLNNISISDVICFFAQSSSIINMVCFLFA